MLLLYEYRTNKTVVLRIMNLALMKFSLMLYSLKHTQFFLFLFFFFCNQDVPLIKDVKLCIFLANLLHFYVLLIDRVCHSSSLLTHTLATTR